MPTPNPQTQSFNPTSQSDVKAEEYKLLKKSVQLRQGFEAMMVDKIMRQNEAVFDLTDRLRNGTLGQPGGLALAATKDDNMGVNVGDVINNSWTINGLPAAAAATIAGGLTGGANGTGGGNGTGTPGPGTETPDPPKPPEPEPPVKVEDPVGIPTDTGSGGASSDTINQTVNQAPGGNDRVIIVNVPTPPAQVVSAPPPVASTSTVTQNAPGSWFVPSGSALAAVVGLAAMTGLGAGMYALGKTKTPPAAPAVVQPDRPVVTVPPDKPAQPPPGGWKLGANVSKPEVVPRKEK